MNKGGKRVSWTPEQQEQLNIFVKEKYAKYSGTADQFAEEASKLIGLKVVPSRLASVAMVHGIKKENPVRYRKAKNEEGSLASQALRSLVMEQVGEIENIKLQIQSMQAQQEKMFRVIRDSIDREDRLAKRIEILEKDMNLCLDSKTRPSVNGQHGKET